MLVQSGTGDSILSNSIVFNGQQGIALANGNDLQAAPTLTGVSGGGTGSNVEGSLTSVAEYELSDPVLQQPDRGSVRSGPGADVPGLDGRDDRRRRHRADQFHCRERPGRSAPG